MQRKKQPRPVEEVGYNKYTPVVTTVPAGTSAAGRPMPQPEEDRGYSATVPNTYKPTVTTPNNPVSSGYSGSSSSGGVSINIPTYTEIAKPEYISKYQNQIDELAKAILNREAFSYDHMNDPTYQQYEKSYARMGNRAMEDALGRLSGRTGGMASSYAGSVAQQTYNNYMSDLADIIPELRQLAYSMYVDEGNVMNNNLASLRALEDVNYAKYRDDINDYNLAMERHAALQKAAVEAQAAAAKARSSSSSSGSGYSMENALNYLVNSGVMSDIEYCLREDVYPDVPVYKEGVIYK